MKSVWALALCVSFTVSACSEGDAGGAGGADTTAPPDDVPVDSDVHVEEDTQVVPEDTSVPEDVIGEDTQVPPDDVPQVDPCVDGGGCDPHASCVAEGDAPKCTCNEGWSGPGTTCTYDGVTLRHIDTYEAGGFTSSLPGDPAMYAKVVVVATVDGQEATFPAEPPVDGIYYVPGVPPGPYTVQLWHAPSETLIGAGPRVTMIESEERVLSIGTDYSHRAGTTLLTMPTTITVSATLPQPWQVPGAIDEETYSELEDYLLIYSRGAFINSAARSEEDEDGELVGPSNGDEQINGWTIDLLETSLIGDARALDGTLGDELVLAHFRDGAQPEGADPATVFEYWRGVRSWFEVPNVTLADGGALPVSGTFESGVESTFTVQYAGETFRDLVAPFASVSTAGIVAFTLTMEGAAPTPKVGPFVSLVEATSLGYPEWVDPLCNPDTDPCDAATCPNGCSDELALSFPGDLTQTFNYTNPFDYGQLLASATLTFTARVTRLLPAGESNDRVQGLVATTDGADVLDGKPIEPKIGLPGEIRIGGLDAPLTELRKGVGLAPVVTWTAPTLGTPTYYRLRIWDLTDVKTTSGSTNARRSVAFAYVLGTSFQVPGGLLLPGRIYYVEVGAELEGTYDPATPFVTAAARSFARMPSGPFTVCGCDKDAICTIDADGQEACVCKEGWLGDGQTCTALPCTLKNGGCAPDATCTNGDTAICTCPDGLMHFEWGECAVDPCMQDNGGCAAMATCDGSSGAAVCSCPQCPEGAVCDESGACIALGERCSNPLPLEGTVTGTTVGLADDHVLDDGNPCLGFSMGANAPDAVYQYTATESGEFTFTLEANHDAVLSVRPDCDQSCLGADMERDESGRYIVTVSLEAGTPVFVVVDGYANDTTPFAGPFTLSVSKPPT